MVLGLSGATNNTLQNNLIGTDPTGTVNLGNNGTGLFLVGSASNLVNNNQVGGNTIAYNAGDGIRIP